MFENHDTSSVLVVEPTLTADETHAGDEIADPEKPLPDATTVAIPTDLKLSMSGLYGSLSQCAPKRSPPRLRLTEAILNCEESAYTRSKPAKTSEVKPATHGATPPHDVGFVIRENT
jgi:hypothetical protein